MVDKCGVSSFDLLVNPLYVLALRSIQRRLASISPIHSTWGVIIGVIIGVTIDELIDVVVMLWSINTRSVSVRPGEICYGMVDKCGVSPLFYNK